MNFNKVYSNGERIAFDMEGGKTIQLKFLKVESAFTKVFKHLLIKSISK